jgi:[protein-PII] uridylyltransferase
MPDLAPSPAPPTATARLRDRVNEVRDAARRERQHGANGLQVAATLSQAFDQLVRELFEQAAELSSAGQTLLRQAAVIAVGGTGRGDLAPYSDIDLMFLHGPQAPAVFFECVAQTERNCWDAGLKLGSSVRTIADAIRMARQDAPFATSLIEARRICGAESLFDDLRRGFKNHVIRRRRSQFIEDCIAEREKERLAHGAVVQQLEPDVKRSLGGLRDLQLVRWMGFARYGTPDLDTLKLRGGLPADDVRRLISAHEFLTTVRCDLHIAAGRLQDTLTRQDQLRLADERGIKGSPAQRPVERFMQQYFEESTAVAQIATRFIERHRTRRWTQVAVDYVMSFRVDDIYRVGTETIDVAPPHREQACGTLEGVLQLAVTAARHGVRFAPHLIDHIKQASKRFDENELTAAGAALFLELLGSTGTLGALLRTLYETGVLEIVLPPLRHTRCLLQFNQYHSYTVDEHTLRALETAVDLEKNKGPLGQAYREIHHKELLHLALLLHDAGKGYEEDHSEVGRRLAVATAQRLGLPEHQRDLLVFLVHKHLLMATLAFRRDTSDPEVLLQFNHEVGSPDALQMLYVLTAADIAAVGPTTWNDWKEDLLTQFYDRSMVWLSGKSYLFAETTRREQVLTEVLRGGNGRDEIAERLERFPIHYVLSTPPTRIAADLRLIQRRAPDDIWVEAQYDAETGTSEYRVITSENVSRGCFHKLTGVLTAKRLEILSAQISTSQDGVIVDSYRVRDYDHTGAVPQFRFEEVETAIRKALRGELDVESLFLTRRRFSPTVLQGPVSNLPLRVAIDNETSDRYTVVDVFAHDRPGLLYRITRSLFELDVSVALARISTHFDQVVDVFYVTDANGEKIRDGGRLRHIRDELSQRLTEFEQTAAEIAGR